jgi:hypothetical protein
LKCREIRVFQEELEILNEAYVLRVFKNEETKWRDSILISLDEFSYEWIPFKEAVRTVIDRRIISLREELKALGYNDTELVDD